MFKETLSISMRERISRESIGDFCLRETMSFDQPDLLIPIWAHFNLILIKKSPYYRHSKNHLRYFKENLDGLI